MLLYFLSLFSQLSGLDQVEAVTAVIFPFVPCSSTTIFVIREKELLDLLLPYGCAAEPRILLCVS